MFQVVYLLEKIENCQANLFYFYLFITIEYSGFSNKLYTHKFNYYDDIAANPCKRPICATEDWSIANDEARIIWPFNHYA